MIVCLAMVNTDTAVFHMAGQTASVYAHRAAIPALIPVHNAVNPGPNVDARKPHAACAASRNHVQCW